MKNNKKSNINTNELNEISDNKINEEVEANKTDKFKVKDKELQKKKEEYNIQEIDTLDKWDGDDYLGDTPYPRWG